MHSRILRTTLLPQRNTMAAAPAAWPVAAGIPTKTSLMCSLSRRCPPASTRGCKTSNWDSVAARNDWLELLYFTEFYFDLLNLIVTLTILNNHITITPWFLSMSAPSTCSCCAPPSSSSPSLNHLRCSEWSWRLRRSFHLSCDCCPTSETMFFAIDLW